MTHEFRRFIEEQLTTNGWSSSILAEKSGLSAQQISKLRKDNRDLLPRMPEPETISGLSRAFGVPESEVRRIAVIALGVEDIEAPTIVHELKEADDDQLFTELATRMGLEVTIRKKADTKSTPARKGKKTGEISGESSISETSTEERDPSLP